MNDNMMNIRVSGSAVYAAVKNYLANNVDLQEEIKKTVSELVLNGHIEETAKRMVSEEIHRGWGYKQLIERTTQKVVNEVVQLQIKQIVEEQVKEALRNSVIILPKVD